MQTSFDALAGKINKMAALENIIDEVFVRHFLTKEKNSYEDLLVNRYSHLRSCSLRSVKRFGSCHGIKKRLSVADGTVDIPCQYSTRCHIRGKIMFQIDY